MNIAMNSLTIEEDDQAEGIKTVVDYFTLPGEKLGALVRKVTVTNTGDRDGEETVQLYVNDKVASVVRPVKELKAFKKIFLKAGESKTVQFDISPLALGFYDAAMNYVVEPGEFEIMTGCNSNDLQTISVKLIN